MSSPRIWMRAKTAAGRAGAAGEVVDVDTGVDSPGLVHCGSGDGVVLIGFEAAYEFLGGGDYAQL